VSRRSRVVALVALAAAVVVADAVWVSGSRGGWVAGIVAGLVLGELFVFPVGRAELPLSYAGLFVAGAALDPVWSLAAVATAYTIAPLVRDRPQLWRARVRVGARRVAVGLATVGAHELAFAQLDARAGARTTAFGALLVGGVVLVATDALVRLWFRRAPTFVAPGPMAWAALLSSGALMAISVHGGPAGAGLGGFGVVLFSAPLALAWSAFARVARAERAFADVVDALAQAPELGGLVPAGHAERVGAIAARIGAHLEVDAEGLEALTVGARLHRIGYVTLDEPEGDRPHSLPVVAAAGADVLRGLGPLAPVAEIVAAEATAGSEPGPHVGARTRRLGQVLRVASEFDALRSDELPSVGGERAAIVARARLRLGSTGFDADVLDALDAVIVDDLVAGHGAGQVAR
jgi:hypothetical protein